MSKYKFIYCNKCKDFYLNWDVDFSDYSIRCPAMNCKTKDVKVFNCDTIQEMAQIERSYKIKKLKK